MQSSRNTTDFPGAVRLHAALNNKLKKASANIIERRLASGEYVMYQGRVVSASVVAEAISAEERLQN